MKTGSIRTRLILFMIAVTMVPMIVSLIVTYAYTRESVKEQAIAENSRLLFQGKTNLDNYLNGLSRASLAVYTDPNFIRNLSLSINDYRAIAEIYATLQNMQSSTPDAVQVYLHSRLSGQSTLITGTVPRRELREEPYAGTVDPKGRTAYMEPPHRIHAYGFSSPPLHPDETVLTFYRSITRVPTPDQLAVLAIDVRLDGIREIAGQLFEAGEEELLLVGGGGIVIYSEDSELIGKRIGDDVLLGQIRNGDASGYYDGDGAVHVYEKLDSSFADWTLVKRIPHGTLYRNATRLTSINAVIAVATMLTVIVGTLLISIRITSPIKRLAGYMKQIQNGRLDVEIDLQSRDEIGLLARSFRQMMDRINNLILKEYKLDLANKTSQLKMLQAQINPHFLYNALQSIGTLALQHQAPRIYTLLSSLAHMMRYSMRNNETMVTLRDELEHLRRFLELQRQRFGEAFGYTMEADEHSLDAPVPKMILQPLAENYFKHGMHPDYGGGRLTVAARLREGRLEVAMENNGAPIPEDRLAALRERLRQAEEPGGEDGGENGGTYACIGLYNVLMRLRLHTDDTAELRIGNLEPHGVRVTLTFPV